MRIPRILIIVLSAMLLTTIAGAQDYPTKTVKIIIPFTAGGATDFVGRTVAQKLSEIWGQPIDVENVPGSGGTVGAALVAKAPADGYTLLEYSSAYTVSPSLYKNLPYEPTRDFIDILPLAKQPFAIVVGASSGFSNVAQLIAKAKDNPGEMKFGTPGIGSAGHLLAEQFKLAADINVVHIPFTGGPEAITATQDGTVAYSFIPLSLALKGVKEGKVITLAVTAANRSNALPDVPTLAEAGVTGIDASVWWGIWAPAGIPDSIAHKLEKDIKQVLATSEVIEQFKSKQFEPMSMNSAEFTKFVQKEMKTVKHIVEQAGIESK